MSDNVVNMLRGSVASGIPVDLSNIIANIKDVNVADNEGTTLLMVASAYDHAQVCRVLLERGADPTLKNIEGMTALDIAKTEGNEDAVSIISGWLPSLKCEEDRAIMVEAEHRVTSENSGPKM